MTIAPAYVFDAYGTLFDVHSAAETHAEALGAGWTKLSEIWRTKQLEYTWVLASAGRHDSFYAVTERALDYAIAVTGVVVEDGLRRELMRGYRQLAAYPEVKGVLHDLKRAGARTLILSNGDLDMLGDAVCAAGLEDVLDDVLSVASVGIFKPSMSVYQLAVDATGLDAGDISFQSSNRWDIAGAHVFGLQTVWVNRFGRPDEYPDQPADQTLADLRGLLPG
ncbi:MAG: haloacid dehalogenase type II [Pseudomonadota bacterium]